MIQEGGLTLVEEILNDNSDSVRTSDDLVKQWANIVRCLLIINMSKNLLIISFSRSNVVSWQESTDVNQELEFHG